MEDAIGSDIADYLIKPVNPNQILLSLKRNLENRKLRDEKSTMSYQQEFRQIAMDLNNNLNYDEWVELYKKLVRWELELEKSSDDGIKQILADQKQEADANFTRFVERNYIDWIQGRKDKPVMSHTLVRDKVLPVQQFAGHYGLLLKFIRVERRYALLRGAHVAAVPGVTYGQCCNHYIRIAFTLDIEKIKEGVSRITEFVNTL